jgi:hypothetical protein
MKVNGYQKGSESRLINAADNESAETEHAPVISSTEMQINQGDTKTRKSGVEQRARSSACQ